MWASGKHVSLMAAAQGRRQIVVCVGQWEAGQRPGQGTRSPASGDNFKGDFVKGSLMGTAEGHGQMEPSM
jgi:hypothetical protein